MNFIIRLCMALLLVSSLTDHSLHAMLQLNTCKTMSKKELVLTLKGLPQSLKLYIISLLLQRSIFDFKLYKTFHLEDVPSSVAFSPDGESFLIGYMNEVDAHLWNIRTEKIVATFTAHADSISAVAWNPTGERCLTGSLDCTACVWNSLTGQLITTFKGHRDAITSVAWSPDGKACLTGSCDRTAHVWNSGTGELLLTFKGGHSHFMSVVAFSLDGESCLTGSREGTVCVWNAQTSALLRTFTGTDFISCLAFSADKETFLRGFFDKRVTLSTPKTETWLTIEEPQSSSSTIAGSPDGETFLCGTYGNTASLWNSQTGELLATLTGHNDALTSVAFSQDGEACLTAARDKKVCIWKHPFYPFSRLNAEEKVLVFKHFLPLCLFFQRISALSAEDLERGYSSSKTKGSQRASGMSFQERSEPLIIKGIGAGLDINSGAQQNCTIS